MLVFITTLAIQLFFDIRLNKNNKPTFFVTMGLGLNTEVKSAGSLQMKIDFTYNINKSVSYTKANQFFEEQTSAQRINYVTFGIAYMLPVTKK